MTHSASATARTVSLTRVAAQLRRLRNGRSLTLDDVARLTGVSTSTLSRLENGQRRPTLEVLLELSHTYQIALDDLVAAPEEGGLHVRLKPRVARGRTVIPLTQHAGGMQARKVLVVPTPAPPVLRRHPGSEWLIVLSGRLRVMVGDRASTLGPGEAANFDTGLTHWFGSADGSIVEIISIFAPPGTQMTAGLPWPNNQVDST